MKWSNFRKKIAAFIYPEGVSEVNLRVAKIMADMDPLAPVLKMYHGVFSDEYERPEDKLDKRSQFNMKMWAWQMYRDPSFKYITDWIMNTFGNETLKRVPINDEKLASQRLWYGRAQIATMILFKKEMKRLSKLYEEMTKSPEEFDKHTTIEM